VLPVLGAGDLRRVAAPGCQASPEPWARARPISMSTHAARCLTRPCRRRRSCRGGVNRRGDLHSCCSRWRMSSSVTYGCTDMAATTGHLPTGVRARASALTRTTSGSRGSGGRSSAQGCSRRARGLWVRIRFIVCHLLGRSLPGPGCWDAVLVFGPVLPGTVRAGPRMGVTRKCARGWNLPRPAHGTKVPP